jgi:H+/gluconate symporter-like permease
MVTNVAGSAFFVLLAIAVFIFLCFKGLNTGVCAIIAACIAAIGSTESFMTSIFETFPAGAASLVELMFFVFTASGLLAYLMMQTGCAMSVGRTMVKLLGTDRCYLALTITAVILMLAGVGTYSQVVCVLALPLMEAANLPRKVALISAVGIAPAISFCLPIANVPASLPNMFLGTTIFSAPVLSIAMSLIGIVLFFLWITHMVKTARKNGEGFDAKGEEVVQIKDEDLPPFLNSVLPLIATVIAAIVYTKIGLGDSTLVALAQLTGVVVLVILNFSRVKEIGFVKALTEGCPSMWGFLVLAGCVYGFGQVVSKCAAFEPVQNWVLGLSLNPYVTAMISVALIAFLCTDGISAMMIWLPLFGQQYLDMGVNAGALRRLLLCTTQTFDSMPHAQSTAISLSVFGCTHKEAYFDMFVTTVIIPTIFSIVCCICCIVFY